MVVRSINSNRIIEYLKSIKLYDDLNLANVSAVQSLIERGVQLKPIPDSSTMQTDYLPLRSALWAVNFAESTLKHVEIKVFFHGQQ